MSLKSDITHTFEGISAALTRGNIKLAAKILWLFLKIKRLEAQVFLLKKYYKIKT